MMSKTGGDFSKAVVVFPNKRASLFLNAALTGLSDKPMWSPRYMTISELFREHSQLEVGDRIKLVCELYRSYVEVTGSKETLDQFYSWGELMLTDFDDIDKHMANAGKVFDFVRDVHEMDGVEYLEEDQIKELQRFFLNFTESHDSELKRRFLELWSRLHDIYQSYRERLLSQGIAYEGMLYRDVIENAEVLAEKYPEGTVFYFIGFNLLNTVECKLFERLLKAGKAKFYWDYDHYYMKNGSEAGRYISQYIGTFPNELEQTDSVYSNYGNPKEMTFVSAATEDIQARYITQWLTKERIDAGRRTAIVLCDESLLDTVVHCLPEAVQHVNITTGFPLKQAQISSFVSLMVMLLQRGRYTLRVVGRVLRHSYMQYISPCSVALLESLTESNIYYPSLDDLSQDDNLRTFFTPLTDKNSIQEMTQRLIWAVKTVSLNISKVSAPADEGESVNDEKEEDKAVNAQMAFDMESSYRMYTLLNRMSHLMEEESLQIEMPLYLRLLSQVIDTTTIPFHGEPIEGLQIMGVLETRNLDFDHILMLSCNEGKMPAKVNDSSFIPHSVRYAHGLTTVDNKVAIYAYYFYRLLQRASDIEVAYNSSTGSMQSGEMSRFMLQLLAEGPAGQKIHRQSLDTGKETRQQSVSDRQKTETMVRGMIDKGTFSPSALGKYLRCPMKFYYSVVCGMQDQEQRDPDEMDNVDFGNVFHKAAELLYLPYNKGHKVPRSLYDTLRGKEGAAQMERIVNEAFRKELFKLPDNRPMPKFSGLQMINKTMVKRYIDILLDYDSKHGDLTILGLEEKFYKRLNVNTPYGEKLFSVGGIVDRLDMVETGEQGIVRIIDYKTGAPPTSEISLPDLEAIFDPANIDKHSDYFLQTMLYASIVRERFADKRVVPGLLFIKNAGKDDYSPYLQIGGQPIYDVAGFKVDYDKKLRELIEEILDIDKPFRCTEYSKRCKDCIFKQLCGV